MKSTLPSVDTPFGSVVQSIHLPRAPLALVVVQIMFPPVLAIDSGGDLVSAFQERIRDGYPVMEQILGAGITFTEPTFVPQATGGVLWRFSSPDHPWQISLARNFVALASGRYTDRADMMRRLELALHALAVVKPRVCDRVGVRYSSRVSDPDLLARLDVLIRPEVLGVATTDVGGDGVRCLHAVADSLYALPDSALRARWGLVPAGTSIDVSIPPAETDGFLLDFDVFSTSPGEVDASFMLERVRQFCDRQYRFFRWVVTSEFLAAYGAEL